MIPMLNKLDQDPQDELEEGVMEDATGEGGECGHSGEVELKGLTVDFVRLK